MDKFDKLEGVAAPLRIVNVDTDMIIPKQYLKTTADSGKPRVQAFCGQCGSPIYSTTPGEGQQAAYMVRVGILRERDQLAPKRQNWFRSARNWVTSMDAIHKNQKQA